MSFQIEQGLFTPEFTDYHAIFGVPVDADVKDIRKRYLKIARLLHPDSFAAQNEAERRRANDFLSKLVNPAYEYISQEKNLKEHCMLLQLKAKQALKQQETVVLLSDSARDLAATRASSSVEQVYRQTLRDLAEKQYETLDESLNVTGEMSELNLVFLMRQNGQIKLPGPGGPGEPPPRPIPTPPPRPPKPSPPERYIERAKEFEARGEYNKAIKELRDALQIAPKSSVCYSLLGRIYVKTNQRTMAKIHFEKALELDPEDKRAKDFFAQEPKKPPKSSPGRATKPSQQGGLMGLIHRIVDWFSRVLGLRKGK